MEHMRLREMKPNDKFSFDYPLSTAYRFKPGGEYQIDVTAKLRQVEEVPCDCLLKVVDRGTYELDFNTMNIRGELNPTPTRAGGEPRNAEKENHPVAGV